MAGTASIGPGFDLLGFEIRDTTPEDLAEHCMKVCSRSARAARARSVIFANTHLLATARLDPEFGSIVKSADLIMPDGMPVVWAGRLKRTRLKRRVDGPGFMELLLHRSRDGSLGHYFLGGKPEGLNRMLEAVVSSYPGVQVAGAESPPFRALSAKENDAIIDRINASGAQVVWVGLGCPKQERWMSDHRGRLRAAFVFGVGQAFDILAGMVNRAPEWMRHAGLEWLYRMAQEPKRLWKRYLVTAPLFFSLLLFDELKRFFKGLFGRINLFYSYLRLRSGLSGRRPKIVVGAAGTFQSGWIVTDRSFLDLLKESDWSRLFKPGCVGGIVAEHVWEHLSREDGLRAAKLCFNYLMPGGCLRVAVPDGMFPDEDYIQRVCPGDPGSPGHGHQVLYDHRTLSELFESAGFQVVLLEYWDGNGSFHSIPMDGARGIIRRSSKNDPRNKNGDLRYTSLIVDAVKKGQ